jgi:hypothetical protein
VTIRAAKLLLEAAKGLETNAIKWICRIRATWMALNGTRLTRLTAADGTLMRYYLTPAASR